jgi:multidrug efflux pump subunit AcrA (membrane-fusion protein)
MNKPFHRRSLRHSVHLYVLGAAAVVVAILAISQLGTATSSARTETETVGSEWGVVQTTASGSGSVEAGVVDDVDFATSGTLNDVDVHVGEHVTKGQILATLDPTSAELTLAQAKISLEEAETAYTDAEDGIATTGSTGGSSSTGSSSDGTSADTDEQVDPSSTDFVSDDVADTTTMTTTTTKTVTAPLRSRPKTETTTTTSSSTPSESSGKSSGDSSSTTSSSTSTTVSATTIASDKLTVESDEQTVKSDEEAVDDTILRAPVSGSIASLADTSAGESVSAGSSSGSSTSSSSDSSSSTSSTSGATTAGSLGGSESTGSDSSSSSSSFAEIVNTNTLTMTVPFSESDISEIKVGQSATVTLDALTGIELAAKVTAISPTATESDDVVSYDVTLTIDQTDSKVRPGMSASASVIIDQADGVTVPNEAVTGTGSTGTVTLLENGKHVSQQVIVGLRGTLRTEIASGLKSGQQLIVTETLPALGTSTSTTSSTGASSTGTLGGRSSGAFGSGGFGSDGGRFSGGGGGPPGGGAP